MDYTRTAEVITQLIEASGLSPLMIAHRAGLSRKTIYRWLSEEGGMNVSTLFRVAEAAGYEVSISFKKLGGPAVSPAKPGESEEELDRLYPCQCCFSMDHPRSRCSRYVDWGQG